MVVLNVTYRCKPGMRDAFLKAIRKEGLDEDCRSEEGNIKYDYYLAVDNDDEIVLIEHWKDEEAVAIHGAQPHYKRIGEIKSEYVDETVLEKYL